MASVFKVAANNSYAIAFRLKGKQRKFEVPSRKEAFVFKRHIEELVEHDKTGEPIAPATKEWVRKLPIKRRNSLAKIGLVASFEEQRAAFVDGLCAVIRENKQRAVESGRLKGSSMKAYNSILRNLETFFEGKRTDRLTVADAEAFQDWLLTEGNAATGKGLELSTANRRLKGAREFFFYAMENKWIDIESNPFARLKNLEAGKDGVAERHFYVPMSLVNKCIAASTDPEFRLLWMLWRVAGLRRIEPYFIRWEDVTWPDDENPVGRLKVFSPKQRVERKKWRVMPLWPNLLPFLRAQQEACNGQSEFVIFRKRYDIDDQSTDIHQAGTCLYNRVERHIRQSQVESWPKLIQNLRASGETDCVNDGRWSDFTVAYWWNHSVRVQRKHYLTVPDHEFDKAISPFEPPTKKADHSENDQLTCESDFASAVEPPKTIEADSVFEYTATF